MAWVGGTVRANQVLVPSIRCGKAPLSFPLAGAVLPDGDYVISGILQLDGQDPVLLPMAYAAHSGDAFLRLAGEVTGGRVLQKEVGLPDGSFHSQVISWGDRLLLADSRFESVPDKALPAKTASEAVAQPAASQTAEPAGEAVTTVAAETSATQETPAIKEAAAAAVVTQDAPAAQVDSTSKEEAAVPAKTVEPAAASVQGELSWEPSSRTSFSGDELAQVSLTVPMGKTVEWPVTSDPCPPLEGEVGRAIVQAAPAPAEKSVPTLRKARRKATDKAEPAPASEPASTPATVEVAPKARNLDGLVF